MIGAESQASTGFAVKQLDFSRAGGPDEDPDTAERAETPVGIYEVVQLPRGCVATLLYGASGGHGARIAERPGTTRAQAKDACQVHFNALVSACLAAPGATLVADAAPSGRGPSSHRRSSP